MDSFDSFAEQLISTEKDFLDNMYASLKITYLNKNDKLLAKLHIYFPLRDVTYLYLTYKQEQNITIICIFKTMYTR